MSNERIEFRTCPLCEATCGLEIKLEGDLVTRIRGDRDDVFSKGFICPKGTTLGKFHEDPDRLRRPLVKRNGEHVEVSWEEAYAEIAARASVLDSETTAAYLGNPVVHSLDAGLYSRAVTTALGTRTVFSASTVDQRPREMASGLIFGHASTIPVPDLDRTDFLLLLGANPFVSNGSLATAPDWPGRIEALQARGGKLVVVDPAFTRTAEAADQHVSIVPTTDALLLAAIATELVSRDLHRPDPADAETLLRAVDALDGFSPQSVSTATGLNAAIISGLVDDLAASSRPCVYGRLGTTITTFGTTASWLIDVVNALLGAMDTPGGSMFPLNAAGGKNSRSSDPFGPEQTLGRRSTTVSSMPIELGEHPVAAMAEEIEAGNITTLVTIAGNPVLSCPDSARLDVALAGVDFMVSVDCYLNETTRHADVVLPATSPLQKPHFDLAFGGLSVRNVANWSAAIIDLADGELPEWEVLARLASVLGGAPADTEAASAVDDLVFGQLAKSALNRQAAPDGLDIAGVQAALAHRSGPERLIDLLVQTGPYGDWFQNGDGLTLDRLIDNPHGIDFGPLEPRLPSALSTPSGRPEYAHPELLGDIDRLANFLAERTANSDELVLINRRTLRSNNSWMHNIEVLVKGKLRCTVLMNPTDANARDLATGSTASVRSGAGAIELPVEVSDSIRPGVVSIPHGWGHDKPGTRMSTAHKNSGANVNTLTPTWNIDPLSGTSQLTGIPVTVTAT